MNTNVGDVIETDALIVGAGPCGLFQIFELGLLGIKCHILDSLPAVGGQCTELYPDKPLYDIPAIPSCTGNELIQGLMDQVKPFDATFHLGQEVQQLTPRPGGGFDVETSRGTRFLTKTVFIAGGVGSFQPRKVKVAGIKELEDRALFYKVINPDQFAGKDIVVLGGGDSALDWALALAGSSKSLSLVHRRPEFRAAPASVEQFRQLSSSDSKLKLLEGNLSGFTSDEHGFKTTTITTSSGEDISLDTDCVLAFFGLSPKLGPIAEWGLDLHRKTVSVDTEKFQTNIPGIFAIGDVNHYPGKKKLILSGFHEAALAAFAAKELLEPGKKVLMQYTTTSPLMHERLGVTADE